MRIETEQGLIMGSSHPLRVLYMEDNPGLGRLLQRRLNRLGYDVDTAPDGEIGLAMYNANPYDVLALDQEMPRKTGIEVIRELAARGPLPPTIVVTGAGSEMVAVEAMKMGASDYIIKDPDGRYLELIPSIIEKAVEVHRMREDKQRAEEALRRANDELEDRVGQRTEELRNANQALRNEVEERRKLTESLRKANRLLEALTLGQMHFISRKDGKDPFHVVLKLLVALTESVHGSITEIVEPNGPDATPTARCLSRIIRSGETEGQEGECDAVPDELATCGELVAGLIASGKPVIFSDGTCDSSEIGLTSSFPGPRSMLAIPLSAGDRVIGIIWLADRERGYDTELIGFIEPCVYTCATMIEGVRNERNRLKMVEELRLSEERFRTIVDSASDLIFIKNVNRQYSFVNPAFEEVLARNAAGILGRTDEELFAEDGGNLLMEIDARVLKGERIETQLTRSLDGAPVTFLETRFPMGTPDGRIVGICGIARNVTDRREGPSYPFTATAEYASKAMRSFMAAALLAAQKDSTILLRGESGAGNDYFARYIHDRSKRSGKTCNWYNRRK
ncbi:MAG: response regulator [Pseudomonadota bacterium]